MAFVEFDGLGDGGVEAGAVTGAGHGDVGAFAVETGGTDDEHVARSAVGKLARSFNAAKARLVGMPDVEGH